MKACFGKILVPLDGTPQANAALPVARTFARALGASITLLQVASERDEADLFVTHFNRALGLRTAERADVTELAPPTPQLVRGGI